MRSLETILHVCAWGFPAGQTVVALVRRDVDADDLTGRSLLLIIFYFSSNTNLCFIY